MPKRKQEKIIIISGMHRSGTSLVASTLQEAGLDIGQNLLGPGHGNLRGHFEEIDFYHFHENILSNLGLDMFVNNPNRLQKFSKKNRKEAQDLIDSRQSQDVWGWKEPRTSLFLQDWKDILGERARFIFIYRHPVEVALSLIRRDHLNIQADPTIAIRTWITYNKSILSFLSENQNAAVLCNISSITSNFDTFGTLLKNKLSLKLDISDAKSIYSPEELKQFSLPKDANDLFGKIVPDAFAIYKQLENMADMPEPPASQIEVSNFNQTEFANLTKTIAQNGKFLQSAQSELLSMFLAILAPDIVLHLRNTLINTKEKVAQADKLEQKIQILEASLNQKNTDVMLPAQSAPKEIVISQNYEDQITIRDSQIVELQQTLTEKTEQIIKLLAQCAFLEENKKHLEKRNSAFEEQINDLRNTIMDHSVTIVEKKADIRLLEDSLKRALEVEDKYVIAEEQNAALKGQVLDQKYYIQKVKNDLKVSEIEKQHQNETANAKLQDLKIEVEEKIKALESLNTQVVDQKRQINRATEEIAQEKIKNESLQNETEKLKQDSDRLDALKEVAVQYKRQTENLSRENLNLNTQVDSLKKQLLDQKRHLEKMGVELSSKDKLIQSASTAEEQIEKLENDLKRNSTEKGWIINQNENLEDELIRKENHIGYLENELEILQNSTSLKFGRKLYPLKRIFNNEKSNGNK